jgi:hypothetical protein
MWINSASCVPSLKPVCPGQNAANFTSLRQSVERMRGRYRENGEIFRNRCATSEEDFRARHRPPASDFFTSSDLHVLDATACETLWRVRKTTRQCHALTKWRRVRFVSLSRSGSGGGYAQRSRCYSADACASCCRYCGVKAQAAARFATDCLVFGGARLPIKPSRNSAAFAQDSTHECPTG